MNKMKYFDAIILAAGNGIRFGGKTPKQFLKLNSTTVLDKSIDILISHKNCKNVIVVLSKNFKKFYLANSINKKIKFIIGGKNRSNSVYLGLKTLNYSKNNILIHDAARPGISHKIIDRLINNLIGYVSAVIPGLLVNDSIAYQTKKNYSETVKRENLYKIQTPQLFLNNTFDLLGFLKETNFTDEAELARLKGKSVKIIDGDEYLHKITTNWDYEIIKQKLTKQRYTRIGSGFDVHAFSNEKGPLRIGGIDIPYKYKLKGHSDADVVLHAITDAILGSISEGDIGTHFPPSENKWKNMKSSYFLKESLKKLLSKGGILINIDITIICESPKILKYKIKMIKKIADICSISKEDVSVKATTTEGLGFTGRKEGIATLANVTILK